MEHDVKMRVHLAGFMQPLPGQTERERETLHLFQLPRADQMPDPIRFNAIMYSQAVLDENRNTTDT